jgi:hypothetical protein
MMRMALTSASTDAQVWAEFDDNADYESSGSRTEAIAFRTAIRYLMRRRPTEIGRGNRSITMESLQQLYVDCGNWLDLNPSTSGSSSGRVRYVSMENFRG